MPVAIEITGVFGRRTSAFVSELGKWSYEQNGDEKALNKLKLPGAGYVGGHPKREYECFKGNLCATPSPSIVQNTPWSWRMTLLSGVCSVCLLSFAVTRTGNLRVHGPTDNRSQGSGKLPA